MSRLAPDWQAGPLQVTDPVTQNAVGCPMVDRQMDFDFRNINDGHHIRVRYFKLTRVARDQVWVVKGFRIFSQGLVVGSGLFKKLLALLFSRFFNGAGIAVDRVAAILRIYIVTNNRVQKDDEAGKDHQEPDDQ